MYKPDSMLDFKRRQFEASYSKLNKDETLKELLFLQMQQNENLVLIRKNTGRTAWMVVLLIFLVFILTATIIGRLY